MLRFRELAVAAEVRQFPALRDADLLHALPRWVTDPRVADWISEDEVLGLIERDREWKRTRWGSPAPGPVMSHEDAGRMFAAMKAIARLRTALDIVYGVDMRTSKWAGSMQWDAAPGGPPADLVMAARVGLT